MAEDASPTPDSPADQNTIGVFLSVIFPVYNEATRLPSAMQEIQDFLKKQSYPAEVLIVENGSRDNTWELARQYAGEYDNVRAIQVSPAGKGRAIRKGMLEARGEYRFMCDVDFSMPANQIARFLPPQIENVDVVIGTRESAESDITGPESRKRSGRLFNLITRALVLPKLRDTQCGFKCFRAQVAEEVFGRQSINGYAFDVEALCIARRRGFYIAEVPITWVFDEDTRVNVLRDGLKMLGDLLRIRWRIWCGRYDGG